MNSAVQPRLRLDGLQTTLLQPVDLELAAGQILALHGPSGAGKSLLLRAIADLDVNKGEAWLDGRARSTFRPADWRRQVMLIPAESHWWAERIRPHAPDWDTTLLAELGFDPEVLDWDTARLSSGERQRLALVRALQLRPTVLLLDEPTANLDPTNSERVERLLRHYQQESNVAILWVSHDPAQRQRVADRCARIDDGRLEEEAP